MDKQTYIDNFVISYMSGKSFPTFKDQPDGNFSIRYDVAMAFNIAEICWQERQKRIEQEWTKEE